MARYMIQVSYTSETWATQIKNPTNRLEAVAAMLAPAGITFVDAYYAFGEYDIVAIIEGPDNVSAAAAIIAVAAGGATSKVQTTVLMSAEEGLEAVTRAGSIGYQPAGS
jgi:uncharacterized protein with GYD domain